MLGHCFLKFKLARATVVTEASFSAVGSINLDSQIDKYHTGVA